MGCIFVKCLNGFFSSYLVGLVYIVCNSFIIKKKIKKMKKIIFVILMFFSVNTAFGASYTMNTNYTFQNPTFYQILDNRSEKFENNFIPFLDNVSNATEFCLTYSGSYSTHTSKGFS
jgi:hypothetical protein